MSTSTKTCNFCGKEYTEQDLKQQNIVLYKSKAEGVRICSSCLTRAYTKFKDRQSKIVTEQVENNIDIGTPKDIKSYLDEWVIDQERPKIAIATELYAHKKRIKRLEENPEAAKELRLDKSNMIFMGPTGVGRL